jgi:hypothetical protein
MTNEYHMQADCFSKEVCSSKYQIVTQLGVHVFPVFLPRFSLVDGGQIFRVQAAPSPSFEQRHVLQSCLKTEPGSQFNARKKVLL